MDRENALADNFVSLWDRIVNFIPQLLAAILVLIIGIVIANLLAKLIRKVIHWLKLDELFNRLGVNQKLRGLGFDFTLADIFAWIVKWFIILATLVSAADILKMPQVSEFLDSIVSYIPKVFVAVIILTFGFILADFIGDMVRKAEGMSKVTSDLAQPLALITEWAIIIFSFMAALTQLGIAVSLINILFGGFVLMMALAGGLAFGLGGRDGAAKLIEQLTNKFKK